MSFAEFCIGFLFAAAALAGVIFALAKIFSHLPDLHALNWEVREDEEWASRYPFTYFSRNYSCPHVLATLDDLSE